MYRVAKIFLLLLVCGALSGLGSEQASAQTNWGVAMMPAEDLLEFVGGLSDEAPGADTAPAVFLLREYGWHVRVGHRLLARNSILRINDADAVAGAVNSFWLDARGEILLAKAFRIREGEVEEVGVRTEPGADAVTRANLHIDGGDLQSGDILGFTSVSRFDGTLYFDRVPAAARAPIANYSIRVKVDEGHNFRIKAENVPGLEVALLSMKDGRPSEWHATASGLPAFEGQLGAGPYEPGTPLVLIVESEEWVKAANAWISTLVWSRPALFLSTIREQSIADMMSASARADEVIAGATTDAEKEAAVFAFVRKELKPLKGDQYDAMAMRDSDTIFASGSATSREMAMVMVSLLAAAGLEAELGVVRSEAWGPLDEELQSFVQFQNWVVRCGGDNARYYAPQVAEAEAGQLPASWGNAWVLAPAPGLVARVSQEASRVLSQTAGDAHAAFSILRAEAKDQGWYRLEQVGGSSK